MKINGYFFSFCLVIGATVCLISCKSENQQKELGLIGEWVKVNLERTECNDSSRNATVTYECVDRTCILLQLKDENQYELIVTENFINLREVGTWKVNGTKIRFDYSEEGRDYSYVYEFEKSGDQLITTYRVAGNNCLETTVWAPYTPPVE